MEHLNRAKEQLKKGAKLQLVLESIQMHIKEKHFNLHLETQKERCYTCLSTLNKESINPHCSTCLGKGYILHKYIPLEKEQLDSLVLKKLESFEEYKVYLKAQKKEELEHLEIDNNTVFYNANMESIGNMTAVVAIANATFNKAISIGINEKIYTNKEAYKYVYKQQVFWKGADNKSHKIQIESILETLEKAMQMKAKILFKY